MINNHYRRRFRSVCRLVTTILCLSVLLRGDIVAAAYDPCKDQPEPSDGGISCEQKLVFDKGIYRYTVDSGQCDVTGTTQSTSVTMPTDATIQDKIAQTFMIGFDASTPKETINDLAAKYKFGGIYLTGTKDAAGSEASGGAGFTSDYFDSLGDDKHAKVQLLVASDEEGGQIMRYKYASDFPSAKAMGAMTNEQVTAIGKSVGQTLQTNGVNLDLAPVLDIDNGKSDGVISALERAFSSDPSVVTEKAGAFAQGLTDGGVTPVFKHFPGLGFATGAQGNNTDRAKATSPDIASLKAKDLVPYATLIGKYGAPVMLSNEYVAGLDDANPASESPNVVGLLRNEYKFNGLIMTDDLKPAAGYDGKDGLPNSIAAAEKAGVNMPLFTFTTEADLKAAIDAVQAAVTEDQINTSVSKIIALKGGGDSTTVAPTTGGSTPTCCSTGGSTFTSSGTDTQGKDYVPDAFTFLTGKGLTPVQAAAVIGNLMWESGSPLLNPVGDESGGSRAWLTPGTGYGIVQWTDPGRQARWLEYARTHLTGGTTDPIEETKKFDNQINFFWYEASEFYGGALAELKTLTDVHQATEQWMRKYENPGNPHLEERQKYADDVMSRYTSGALKAGSGGNSLTGGCADNTTEGFTGDAGDGKVVDCPAGANITCTKSILYSQTEGPWASQSFSSGCGPISECGCGVTSAAMAIATLNNDPKVTPGSLMADWTSNGLVASGKGGTLWNPAGWAAVGKKYNLNVSIMFQHSPPGLTDDDINKMIEALKGGALIVISGKNVDGSKAMPFLSDGGHLILLRGYDADKKQFLVNNPGRSKSKPEATEPASVDIIKKNGSAAWEFKK